MKCSEARGLFSEYHDGELAEDQRSRVSAHVNECSACTKDIAGFEKLSSMASALSTPIPPEHIWSQLEQQLDQQPGDESLAAEPVGELRRWSFPAARLVALAATLLVTVGIGWFTYQSWFADVEQHQFTVEFGHYLDEFRRDPDAAQQLLLAKYQNEFVAPGEAMERVGYRPATADGLPSGYSVESSYVMTMPWCTCVQCLCKRSDGSTLAIFEHDDQETKQWFGDRPERFVTCHGKRCRLVQLNDRLAASWKQDKRYITVVGIRDVAELSRLVAWFDERQQTRRR